MKQGIEKVVGEFRTKWEGANLSGDETISTKVIYEIVDDVRSAIETAFREVRPKESDESPHNGNPMWERKVGYNAALEDLDENMAKYLKK